MHFTFASLYLILATDYGSCLAFGHWSGCKIHHQMTGSCWKTPLLSAALHSCWPSLEISSIDGTTLCSKMPAPGPLLCVVISLLYLQCQQCSGASLVSLVDKHNFKQLWIVNLYLLFPFVTFIMFDRNKIVFFFSLSSCCLQFETLWQIEGILSTQIQTVVGSAVIECLMFDGAEIPLNL